MQFIKNTSSGDINPKGIIIKLIVGVVLISGIIFSIDFFGTGKSILFSKKTIPRIITKLIANLMIKPKKFVLELVFFINCI